MFSHVFDWSCDLFILIEIKILCKLWSLLHFIEAHILWYSIMFKLCNSNCNHKSHRAAYKCSFLWLLWIASSYKSRNVWAWRDITSTIVFKKINNINYYNLRRIKSLIIKRTIITMAILVSNIIYFTTFIIGEYASIYHWLPYLSYKEVT